ncbi:DUF2889 domain-containing protein [Paraburkholderia saeva]|jgi:hypothetical protein|uniref:Molybdopterin-guanine dinucleotide biosynthesis protein MobB n=2 Tax=Paraburkholderia saeva TaxID=2777537 RepID=A0A9N8RYN1_9BURK|nr:DUF2889 domain-containing protein [Paraburkholderia saeva]CAG4889754.1 hypothetical protein R70241_00816 [Paraburkholderia saeva]CAG4897175.1 hypothetical protein R52603_02268 [Paraburkholderia saeva]CAG4913340.1 hypothetical protein LMG31841_04262 [Paraburkholderia saeva]
MSVTSSSASTRRSLHTRRIECVGYERSDGLFDIEGSMRDTKSSDADLLFKTVPAGAPLHDMRIVVTIDSKLVIRHIEAHTNASPSRFCTEINDAYRNLEGLSIGAGFMKEVKSRLTGPKGCTHLTELLGPIATTAIQTLMSLRKTPSDPGESVDGKEADRVHPMADTCYAWRAGGEVVQFATQRRRQMQQREAPTLDARHLQEER